MLYSKTDYFTYVAGESGRHKDQVWTQDGMNIYLQGDLPTGLRTKANSGKCYFAKKHMLTVKAPNRNTSVVQQQDRKGARIARKRADHSKIKHKIDHDDKRYGKNTANPYDGITFIMVQDVPVADLKNAFFAALKPHSKTKTGFSGDIYVDFGAIKIVHQINKSGHVTHSYRDVVINVACDGAGNFSIEHCT